MAQIAVNTGGSGDVERASASSREAFADRRRAAPATGLLAPGGIGLMAALDRVGRRARRWR